MANLRGQIFRQILIQKVQYLYSSLFATGRAQIFYNHVLVLETYSISTSCISKHESSYSREGKRGTEDTDKGEEKETRGKMPTFSY